MGYAFISYSTKNQADADALKQLFERKGIHAWMAPGDIPAGSKYAQVINQAIKECACFVLLLSDAAQRSVWVSKEVERAVHYGKTIIPLKMEEVVLNDEFEFYISTDQIVAIQRIDENAESLQDVITVVRALVNKNGAPAEAKTVEPEGVSDTASDALQRAPETRNGLLPPSHDPTASSTSEKPTSKPSAFMAHAVEQTARLFDRTHLLEIIFYCLGVIAYVGLLIGDPEFALPALLIGIALGFVTDLVLRKIAKKPLLSGPLRINHINMVFFLVYLVVISYAWGNNRYFYDLVDGWYEKSTDHLQGISNNITLIFVGIGIALFGLLWYLGIGATSKKGSGYVFLFLNISAYAALVCCYFYHISAKITCPHLSEIYDPTHEAVLRACAILFGALALLVLVLWFCQMVVKVRRASSK